MECTKCKEYYTFVILDKNEEIRKIKKEMNFKLNILHNNLFYQKQEYERVIFELKKEIEFLNEQINSE